MRPAVIVDTNVVVAGFPIAGNPLPVAAIPDPGDQMLWELLAARADLLLVTSDKRLLRDKAMRGRIITPEAYLALA